MSLFNWYPSGTIEQAMQIERLLLQIHTLGGHNAVQIAKFKVRSSPNRPIDTLESEVYRLSRVGNPSVLSKITNFSDFWQQATEVVELLTEIRTLGGEEAEIEVKKKILESPEEVIPLLRAELARLSANS